MACFTCTPIDLVKNQTESFAQGLFQQLTLPTLNIFGVLTALYAAYLMLDALLKGEVNFNLVLRVIFAACIIRWSIDFLVFKEWFLDPFKRSVFGLTDNVITYACSKAGIENPVRNKLGGPTGLVQAFEEVFLSVLTIANQIKDGSYFLKLQAWIVSLLAAFPFAFSLGYLIFTIIGYHLCLAVLAGLGPVWLLFWFLPATRGMCYAVLRVLVANATELVFVCIIQVFSLVCVKASLAEITKENFAGDNVSFIGGHALVILVLGLVSVFANSLAKTMASSIAGAPTSNKSFVSALGGMFLTGAMAAKYAPLGLAIGNAAVNATRGAFGGVQEAAVDSGVAASVGRSIHYGVSQAFNKITDFGKYH